MASPATPDLPIKTLDHSDPALQLGILIVIATMFGGGGVAYGLANLVVQLAALAVLAGNRTGALACWREESRWLTGLTLLTIALPLIQLVPLPPGAWQTLPGRQLAVEAREMIGAGNWFPLSLDSARTLVAATGLIAPVTVLILALRLSRQSLVRLGWVVVTLGFVQFLIGVTQVLSAGRIGLFYPENPMPGVLFGSFANRNSAGLFLLACTILASLLPLRNVRLQPLRWALIAALVVALLLTRSRSATLLLALPASLVAGRMLGSVGWRRPKILAAVLVLFASIAAILALAPQTRIADTLERFSQTEDARQYLWDDAYFSARKYWPAGAGMGTFDEVHQADESLEYVTPRSAGRAHNDYLELAIEAGAPGLALAFAWIVLTTCLAWRARNQEGRWQAWAGAAILGAITLQSITDYPLRNQTMLCIAAFAFALLYRNAGLREVRA